MSAFSGGGHLYSFWSLLVILFLFLFLPILTNGWVMLTRQGDLAMMSPLIIGDTDNSYYVFSFLDIEPGSFFSLAFAHRGKPQWIWRSLPAQANLPPVLRLAAANNEQ
jgi:hypothetical protein